MAKAAKKTEETAPKAAPAKAVPKATKTEKKAEKKEENKKKIGFKVIKGLKDNKQRIIGNRTIRSMFQAITGTKGLPVGVIEIWGDSASGKTTTAMMLAGELQKGDIDGKKHVYAHADVEQSLNKIYARDKIGVLVDEVITTDETTPLTCGDDAIDFIDYVVPNLKVDVAIIDSIAYCKPRETTEGEMNRVASHANFLSNVFYPRLAATLAKGQTTCFVMNQTRNQVGKMFGDPTITSGGKAPEFYAQQRWRIVKKATLSTKNTKLLAEKDGDGAEVGYVVQFEMTKNKHGYRRGRFEVIVNKGFMIRYAATAVHWARKMAEKGLVLIDDEAGTICGIKAEKLPGRKGLTDVDYVRAITGKEYLVFEAVDAFFAESEKGDGGSDVDIYEGVDEVADPEVSNEVIDAEMASILDAGGDSAQAG